MNKTFSAAATTSPIEIQQPRGTKIIDITLDLDSSNFRMRSYEGFTKDMQFEVEVIKDYPGGLGQIVRGAHMRLHAGTHIDAPSHMVQGGQQVHDLISLRVFHREGRTDFGVQLTLVFQL